MFQYMQMPTPPVTRSADGSPGAAYWQNRADYTIRATLDTTQHRITGSETIHYTNNSPDSLPYLWIQLDQNLFRPGSRGSIVNGGSRWRGAFENGGLMLSRVAIAGAKGAAPTTPKYMIDDTRMRIDLAKALAANGGTIDIEVDWSFVIPEYGADRMGRFHSVDGWVYEVAQWYPRMYVYDDVDGWNPMPYIGQGEFYLEYGDFDVTLTVPHDHIVVSTGELQNATDVLTSEQRARIERARKSADKVQVVSLNEVGKASARPAGDAPLTWHFTAKNVRDVSWASSRAFILDAGSWENVLLEAAYPREGLGTASNPGWENSIQYQRFTISHYSNEWLRYPYPKAINVAGVVGGMEYPMIVFCGVNARGFALLNVTDHELGHSWFPMIVGSDERRWAWMDEGFNTFINHYSNLAEYGEAARPLIATRPENIAALMQSPTADQPIMTHPDFIRPAGLGFLAYRKPGYGLIMLRESILGKDRFDKAFRTYIDRWKYKHPKPWDFFRTIEDVSGEQLGWFWREWFYGTGTLDQAVVGVTSDSAGSHVALANRGEMVMPTVLELTFSDGGTARVTIPVETWSLSDTYTYDVGGGRTVTAVRIDPAKVYPDTDTSNNTWRLGFIP
jgi:hypothetical protein